MSTAGTEIVKAALPPDNSHCIYEAIAVQPVSEIIRPAWSRWISGWVENYNGFNASFVVYIEVPKKS